MSRVKSLNVHDAARYGEQILRLVGDACERATVAGAVRRRQSSVTEVEILAIPKVLVTMDLFGEGDGARRDLLAESVDRLLKSGRLLQARDERGRITWTPTVRLAVFVADDGVEVPLRFTWTTEDEWGVALALRTGPERLAEAMATRYGAVTRGGRAGLLPPEYRVEGYRLIRREDDSPVPMRSEGEFLELVGVPADTRVRR